MKFSICVWNFDNFSEYFEKKVEPHSLRIYEIINYEKRGYLNI